MLTTRLPIVIFVLACVATPPATPADPPAAATQPEIGHRKSEIPDFTFLHLSDTHINPHLLREGEPGPLRGGDTIAWICEEAAKPQYMKPFDLTVPAPSFAIVTGDLTEYGVIDDTWELFEKAFEKMPCPLYVVPGNHDNTWVPMYHIMRKRHGGENYSFDRFGCHFVGLSSASPAEPLPGFDAKTRAWLQNDLARMPQGTPVFIFFHHQPDINEFAPAEKDTFIDLLRNYNVVLMLYGHGHAVNHKNIDGIDGVMGGSTFGPNSGYSIVSVQDGVLRVAYRYLNDEKDDSPDARGRRMRKLLEKPIARQRIRRSLSLATPFRNESDVRAVVRFHNETAVESTLTFLINGREVQSSPRGDAGDYRLPIPDLVPGVHLLTVRARLPDGTNELMAKTVVVERASMERLTRDPSPTAAIRATTTSVQTGRIAVACNDGMVFNEHPEYLVFGAKAEVLGAPAIGPTQIVFGAGDGNVYAHGIDSRPLWTFETTQPLYGAPLIDGDTVFIGDNGGRMHALGLADGKPRWTFERADYSIECKPCVWDDLLVFGAWDGYVYALNRSDGSVKWKSLGPSSSVEKAARYYAPADCGPIAIADKLFVCDRGYRLGWYSKEGKLEATIAKDVSGIGLSEDGRSFYTRGTNDRVAKYDADGQKLWDVECPAGRFPIPPTERRDRVYVCSNIGLLSVMDAADGTLLWQYQATPGFYVMAAVAVDDDGTAYVAGMDGSLTAVRNQNPVPPRPGS